MAYKLHAFKGQGGFARVDIVTDESGKMFAQKTYSPTAQLVDAVGDDHLKRRFVREVKYQKTLNHPNIVQILGDFLDHEPPSFVMPLAECTLKDEMVADPTLGQNLQKVLFDILAGLEFLHSKGLVHRDLKPANVLKFNDSGAARYAISDFGLISVSSSDSSTLTGTNAGGGTENYAAPELINNFRRATAATDIYAFGAILHDIFGNSAQRIPYTELSVSGDMGPVVEKCTKRLPARRYRDVATLREELYQVLNSNEVTFQSSNEECIVQLLQSKTELTDDEWDNVFLQIDSNLSRGESISNIISVITLAHIDHLKSSALDLFLALGGYFSESIMGATFGFDYCDVLGSKALTFYDCDDISLKSSITLAMLYLGTSHNRWYVERIASGMISNSITQALAERLMIEIEVQGFDFKGKINHMTRSIGYSSSSMHPRLRDLLS